MLSDALLDAAKAIQEYLGDDYYCQETKDTAWQIIKDMDRLVFQPGMGRSPDQEAITEDELEVLLAKRKQDAFIQAVEAAGRKYDATINDVASLVRNGNVN